MNNGIKTEVVFEEKQEYKSVKKNSKKLGDRHNVN